MKKIAFLMSFILLLSWQGMAQFTQDFEGTFLPTGWTKETPDLANDITKSSTVNHTATGSNSARFSSYSSGSNYNQYLFSQAITVSAPNTELKFWHYQSNSTSEIFEWGVSTTTATSTAISTWNPVVLSTGNWVEETINLAPYIGQTIYFSWHYYGNYSYYVYLDDVSLGTPPACPKPVVLTVNNLTTTSVDLAWTENGTATTWNVEWGTTGFVLGAGTMVSGTTTNPYSLTGLTPNTSYEFYVQADCGGSGTSIWVGPYSFFTGYCTPSSTSSTTYIDNFNTIGGSLNISNLTSGYTTGGYLDATTQVVESYANGSFDFNATAIGGSLGFAIWIDWNNDLVFDNATEKVYTTTSYVYGPFSGTINVPNGTAIGNYRMRLAVDYNQSNPTNPCNAFTRAEFEDYTIAVATPPACLQPSALSASVFDVSANLGWTEMGTATSWNIEWGLTGFTQGAGTLVSGTTTNPYNLTGLTASTTYQFYVQADCGGSGTSSWVGPYSFTTACSAFTIPFSENFSSTSPTESCWTVIDNNNDGDLWDMNYTSSPLVGNQVAVLYTDANAGSNDDYLVTPTLILTGNERLRFHYRVQSAGEPNDFQVTLSTTGISPASFTNVLMPLTSFSNITYIEQTINLNAFTGNVNIAFHVPSGGIDGWRLYIDSVVVETIPSCPDPLTLTASNITDVSANLGWTEMGSATTWDIEWGIAGFTPTGTPNILGTTTNPHNLTGLTASTNYAFYVRSYCGVGDSSIWVGPFAFKTTCAPVIAPWNENFENAGSIPNCWKQGSSNLEAWKFANTGSANHIGNNGVITGATSSNGYFAWVDDSTPDNVGTTLESPLIDISTLTVPELSFYLISNNEGHSNVNFSVNIWDGAAWNVGVFTHNTNTVGGWEKVIIDLTTFNITGLVQLRFIVDEPVNSDFYDDVAIDDVDIHEKPTCPSPNLLSATSITAVSANLGWTENGTATAWDIEWGIAGFTPTGTPNIVGTNSNPYNLTGLTANTNYSFYVRAYCGVGDSSTWVGPLAFVTPCATIIPYYAQGFTTFLPDACWNKADNGDLVTGPTTIGTSSWLAGTAIGNTAKINLYTNSRSDWMLSPYFDLSLGGYEIVLDVAVTNYSSSTPDIMGSDDSVRVVYTEDGLIWNTLMVFTAANNLSNTLTTYTMLIPSVGNNVRFGILATDGPIDNTEDYDFHVDNFIVRTPPTCPSPNILTATNITAVSADLGWTENGSATAWNVEWGATGFTPGTGTMANGVTNPYNLTGLTANTNYEYYVRAYCGVGDSSIWVGPLTFKTPCNVLSVPFLEDFEAGSTSIDCWSQTQVIGTSNWTYATGAGGGVITSAHSGTLNAKFVSMSGTGSPVTKLISPIFDITTLTSPQLSFYYGQEKWVSDQNILKVYYRTSTANPWVEIFSDVTSIATWTKKTLVLPNPSTTYQLAFEGINNYGRANVIDDVEIKDGPAPCSIPSNLTAYNITQTSAMLDWTENGTATAWDIEWGFQGFTLGTGTPVHVTAKPYLLNGLAIGTSYSYYVRADCGGGDTSLWVGPFVFMTPPCTPLNIYLGADTTLCSTMSITLDAGVAGPYGYAWSTSEGTQTIVVDTAKTGGNGTFNITLTVIDFSTMCTYNDDINITFTNCVGIEENTENSGYSIFPNPTNGLFTVQNVTGEKATIEVLNIQGKVVYKNSLNSSSQKIDLTDNTKGLYFVNITSDKGVEVYKVILQ